MHAGSLQDDPTKVRSPHAFPVLRCYHSLEWLAILCAHTYTTWCPLTAKRIETRWCSCWKTTLASSQDQSSLCQYPWYGCLVDRSEYVRRTHGLSGPTLARSATQAHCLLLHTPACSKYVSVNSHHPAAGTYHADESQDISALTGLQVLAHWQPAAYCRPAFSTFAQSDSHSLHLCPPCSVSTGAHWHLRHAQL